VAAQSGCLRELIEFQFPVSEFNFEGSSPLFEKFLVAVLLFVLETLTQKGVGQIPYLGETQCGFVSENCPHFVYEFDLFRALFLSFFPLWPLGSFYSAFSRRFV